VCATDAVCRDFVDASAVVRVVRVVREEAEEFINLYLAVHSQYAVETDAFEYDGRAKKGVDVFPPVR
jgi:hypothetical protein